MNVTDVWLWTSDPTKASPVDAETVLFDASCEVNWLILCMVLVVE
jgi:hypothetical protein